jgi:hypothetical protein
MNWAADGMLEIARRRERLVARAGAQRAAIAGTFQELETPIAMGDRALEVVRFLRSHPVLAAAAVMAATVVLRSRVAVSLAGRALAVWRLWRTVSAWSSRRSD